MKISELWRFRVECLNCRSSFQNNNYKTIHENNKHNAKHVNIKVVGTLDNPFAAYTSNQ